MQGTLDWIVVALRWAHIVAILGWVGSSLYFMWLESKLRSPQPARDNVIGEAWMGHGGGFYIVEKRRIAARQVPSPVYWFRNEAAITWVTGFLLLVFVYYWSGGVDLVDPQHSLFGPRGAIVIAIVSFPIAWLVYDRLWVSPMAEARPVLTTVISLLLLLAVIYALCRVFSGRAAFIHVGSILGTNMVASVWTRIIPAQEQAVAAAREGRERDPVRAARARRRALHNTYLTLPVIFTMIANHAPAAYAHTYSWLLLTLFIAAGIGARHLMILYDRRQLAVTGWLLPAAPVVGAIAVVLWLPAARPALHDAADVPFTVVRGIVDLRCTPCHAEAPRNAAYVSAAGGVTFATAQDIAARAASIRTTSVTTQAMPPANITHMTDEERALLARWLDGGARID